MRDLHFAQTRVGWRARCTRRCANRLARSALPLDHEAEQSSDAPLQTNQLRDSTTFSVSGEPSAKRMLTHFTAHHTFFHFLLTIHRPLSIFCIVTELIFHCQDQN